MVKKNNLETINLSKTFLFVDDDESTFVSVKRIANIYGVQVQTANTAHNALVLLHNEPEKYFLILTDQFMPGMNGDELLEKVRLNWPHIRRAMLSGDETSDAISKGYQTGNIFRYLRKPFSENNIKLLIEDACKDFVSEAKDNQNITFERSLLLGNLIKEVFINSKHLKQFENFDHDMLLHCQHLWQVGEIRQLPLIEKESASFKQKLEVCLKQSLINVRDLLEHSEEANQGFTISSMMKQFNIRGLRSIDRYIMKNEAIFSSFINKFIQYFEILGTDRKDMIFVTSDSIVFDIGERYFYNDLFNPILSSVEKGIELASLHMELMMLLISLKIYAKPSNSKGFSIVLPI